MFCWPKHSLLGIFAYKCIIELWPCTAQIPKYSYASSEFQHLIDLVEIAVYVQFSRSLRPFLMGDMQ